VVSAHLLVEVSRRNAVELGQVAIKRYFVAADQKNPALYLLYEIQLFRGNALGFLLRHWFGF
jgi:hypothetical protein